jgi:hypothetical protein
MTVRDQFLVYALSREADDGWAGVLTGGVFRSRVAKALEAEGLMVKVHLRVLGDSGFAMEPERYRWGWALTAAGRVEARRIEAENKLEPAEPRTGKDGDS